MAWSVSANVSEFSEAVDWFRGRIAVTPDDINLEDHRRKQAAFWVAGVQELEVANEIQFTISQAIRKGTPFDQWKRETKERLERWKTTDAHMETVFRNAVQSAYNAGRYQQLTHPDNTLVRPFLVFDATIDSRTTDICRPRNGIIKAHDDPYVLTHWPPLHHRCRSAWRALRASQVKRLGGVTPEDRGDDVQDGFGLAPPMRVNDFHTPDRSRFASDMWAIFEERQRTIRPGKKKTTKKKSRKKKTTKKKSSKKKGGKKKTSRRR